MLSNERANLDPGVCVKEAVKRAKKLAKNVGTWIVANAAPAMTCFVPRIWLQDTGSGFNLVDKNRCDQFTLDHAQPLDTPLSLNTANGE